MTFIYNITLTDELEQIWNPILCESLEHEPNKHIIYSQKPCQSEHQPYQIQYYSYQISELQYGSIFWHE